MGNEHCPICGADAETPDKAFFYYECGFTVNRQSGAVIRHCKNEELVEANKRIAALEAENAALLAVNKRLNSDANQLMESNAQLTAELAALCQALLPLIENMPLVSEPDNGSYNTCAYCQQRGKWFDYGDQGHALDCVWVKAKAALEAAGLVEEEQDA